MKCERSNGVRAAGKTHRTAYSSGWLRRLTPEACDCRLTVSAIDARPTPRPASAPSGRRKLPVIGSGSQRLARAAMLLLFRAAATPPMSALPLPDSSVGCCGMLVSDTDLGPTTAPVQLKRTLRRRSTSLRHRDAAGGSHSSAATDLQSRIIQLKEQRMEPTATQRVTGLKRAAQKQPVRDAAKRQDAWKRGEAKV